jgi:hypothetical protein
MSDISQDKTTSGQVPPQSRGKERVVGAHAARPAEGESSQGQPQPTRWVGWVLFGAMMMILVGAFQGVVGLTSLFKTGYYVAPSSDLVVNVDYTVWGWVHIGLGAVAIAAGFGLLAGQMWARVVGIAMALVSAVVNLAFVPAYPLWSLMVITLDVLVIYAIAAHGREMRAVD